MGKHLDVMSMSAHTIVDRADRIRYIENTIGYGTIIAETPDPAHEGLNKVLTSTGVLIVRNATTKMIITLWIAGVKQAENVWYSAKPNKPMPKWLWNVVNYNNNTAYWKRLATA